MVSFRYMVLLPCEASSVSVYGSWVGACWLCDVKSFVLLNVVSLSKLGVVFVFGVGSVCGANWYIAAPMVRPSRSVRTQARIAVVFLCSCSVSGII